MNTVAITGTTAKALRPKRLQGNTRTPGANAAAKAEARPPAPTSSSNLNGVLTATSNTATLTAKKCTEMRRGGASSPRRCPSLAQRLHLLSLSRDATLLSARVAEAFSVLRPADIGTKREDKARARADMAREQRGRAGQPPSA
jgi:hypothetical protein